MKRFKILPELPKCNTETQSEQMLLEKMVLNRSHDDFEVFTKPKRCQRNILTYLQKVTIQFFLYNGIKLMYFEGKRILEMKFQDKLCFTQT